MILITETEALKHPKLSEIELKYEVNHNAEIYLHRKNWEVKTYPVGLLGLFPYLQTFVRAKRPFSRDDLGDFIQFVDNQSERLNHTTMNLLSTDLGDGGYYNTALKKYIEDELIADDSGILRPGVNYETARIKLQELPSRRTRKAPPRFPIYRQDKL